MSKTPLDMRETWNKVGMTEIEIWNNASQNDRDKMAERATIERCAQIAKDAFTREDGLARAYIVGEHIAKLILASKEKL